MLPRLPRQSILLCRGTRRALAATPQCLSRARTFVQSSSRRSDDAKSQSQREELLATWSKFYDLKDRSSGPETVQHLGFLGKRRDVSKHLSFAELETPSGQSFQICSTDELDSESHRQFRQIPAHAPVLIHASLQQPKDAESSNDVAEPDRRARESPSTSPDTTGRGPTSIDGESGHSDQKAKPPNAKGKRETLRLHKIRQLNTLPKNFIVTPSVVFPQTKRHLQIRFHPELQARLKFRSWLKGSFDIALQNLKFHSIETPALFKSTPEGAREFLVPTRNQGTAYALSQSPQQYKQVLMASGIMRYAQWARCYRDEDLRADRQPEFTQLDMEMAFADSWVVKGEVIKLMSRVMRQVRNLLSYKDIRGSRVPVKPQTPPNQKMNTPDAHTFSQITFAESIASYGSDKPDLRIPSRIYEIKDLEPFRDFIGMITHLPTPMVEVFSFSLDGCSPELARTFVTKFMDDLPLPLGNNPDGKPQVLIYDSSKPMCGFSSLGFEYQAVLDLVTGTKESTEGNKTKKELKDGDLVVFQAREKPTGQYCLGSTKIGELRSSLWKALVEAGYMSKPRLGDAKSLQFVWVTEFPMFKPVEEGEPGQGGTADITAAHHPFTAPLTQEDLELLFTNPTEAKSAAYDLVLNGVEIGGGSARIHTAELQEFIMRDVLKMSDKRIGDFSHLLEALRSGCPPHAGFALGFDRLTAIMTDTATVRDVIAFPKTMKGEDAFVRSPTKLTDEQLAPYGLQLRQAKKAAQ